MSFVFLNSNQLKTEDEITGAYHHNERKKEAYLSNPNIRREYTNQNYHFKSPEMSYVEVVHTCIEMHKIKLRKNSTLLVDGVISPSPEWVDGMSHQEQMEFFFRAYEYVKCRYMEKNILSAVVHMDEDTPHLHFDVIPITPDGRLSACYFTPYPDGKLVEQSMFFEYMHSYYPELYRGVPEIMSEKDHLAMKYFKAVPDYFEMGESMWKAIQSIEGKGKELQEKKDFAVSLYSAVSKMAAYTIVMQEGEINYYKKKLVPHLLEELQKKEKRIEEFQEKKKGRPIRKNRALPAKSETENTEDGVQKGKDILLPAVKHIPAVTELL